MEFLNGSGQPIDTIHSDTISFFEMLSQLVNEEPADVFTPLERFYMQAIGIEKDKPFAPDAKTRALLAQAAHTAAAMARANSFASRDADTYFYPDRKWQYVGELPYTWLKDGVLQVDRRAYVYYMALGNSPGMMEKNVGVGSYYLWAYKDAAGNFLDGAKNYKLHIPANVPAHYSKSRHRAGSQRMAGGITRRMAAGKLKDGCWQPKDGCWQPKDGCWQPRTIAGNGRTAEGNTGAADGNYAVASLDRPYRLPETAGLI